MEYMRVRVMKADILMTGSAVMAGIIRLNNISNNSLARRILSAVHSAAQFFNHAAVLVSTNSRIAVIAVPLIITDVIGTDSRSHYPDQHFVLFWLWSRNLRNRYISRFVHQ